MHTTPKILLAGPWVGEFGWELFCWQGFVRRLSKQYDKTIVIGRPTNELLYSDFADEYIKFDPESFKTDAWNCHGAKSAQHIVKEIEHTDYLSGNFDIGMRYSQQGVSDTRGLFKQQDFVKIKSDKIISDDFSLEGYDVIFHCRNKSTGSDRNWSYEQWCELYELLDDELLVACIGNDESFHIPGTDDLRNIDLDMLIAIMQESDLIIGPSSGPMHLASLSGLKHLVWSTEYNRVRYEKDWNPLKTSVVFYSEGGWNPEPKKIAELVNSIV